MTSNFNLNTPAQGATPWDADINQNFDDIDSLLLQAMSQGLGNSVINPIFQINQQGVSFPATGLGINYIVDGWKSFITGVGDIEWSVVEDSPNNLSQFCLQAVPAAVVAPGPGHFYAFQTKVRGREWGRYHSHGCSLIFYVKGSLSAVGNYNVFLQNDNGSRFLVSQYAVTDDWTQIQIDIPAESTASGYKFDWDVGIDILFLLDVDPGFIGAATLNTWLPGPPGGPILNSQKSFMDAVTNELYITQVAVVPAGYTKPQFYPRSFADDLRFAQEFYWHTYDYGTAPGAIQDGPRFLSANVAGSPPSVGILTYHPVKKDGTPNVTYYNPVTGAGPNTAAIRDITNGTDASAVNIIDGNGGWAYAQGNLSTNGGPFLCSTHVVVDGRL